MTNRKPPVVPTVEPETESPEDRLGPTEVAILIGKRYQYTRDLMLKGEFGKPKYDKKNPKGVLTVSRAQVTEYLAKQTAPKT